MTKLCRQYIYQVKLLLPTVGKAEKKYLATLANNLEDFCKDTSPETIHDLYKDFGRREVLENPTMRIKNTGSSIL